MRVPKHLVTLVAGILVGGIVAVSAAAAVEASASTTDTTYYACLSSGRLSNVATVPPTCNAPATSISWNQTGPQGPAGNTVLSGTGAPSTTIGKAGNFYLETSNHEIYGPATHTCSPLPCHTIWGAGTSLVGPPGPPGQGTAYDTQASGPISDPSGASIRVLTQTLPSGGDFSVTGRVVGESDLTGSSQTFWECNLVGANPGGQQVILDTSDASGGDEVQLNVQGVVSLAPNGTIGINCDETLQQTNDSLVDVHITSTRVSGLSIVAPG